MKTIELIKKLESEGWTLFNVRGEHYQYKHPSTNVKVTLPPPYRTVPAELTADFHVRA